VRVSAVIAILRAGAIALLLVPGWSWAAGAGATVGRERFFDDFSQTSLQALQQDGWILRDSTGHPGPVGATWGPQALRLVAQGSRPEQTWLELEAQTDGTPGGTRQAQICQQRKFFHGTTSARIRFHDRPVSGADGDPVIQTFYSVAPLRHDFDPEFSEIDFEYLANGGWGSPDTRLYAITWQTVRIEPWLAYNQSHERPQSLDGWHQLTLQVDEQRSRLWLDDRLLAEHGGRNHPVVPMAISFNLWFSPEGLLPVSAGTRVWQQQVDWVFHARNEQLRPSQVRTEVQRLRRAGTRRLDKVPAADPPLDSPCDI
jgi:hypothetical protein